MKILSMTAVFGKLDGQTLQLHDGLNPITAPNEWGKSTWCAFLTAMLYGLDETDDPEHCRPWSGRSPEGTLRIFHRGRDITIRRRTRGLTPMGEFLAWETQTGRAIRELTGENCGKQLLGVEKDIFLQTGFLRSPDRSAENRRTLSLDELLAAAERDSDASLLEERLRALQDRCSRERIPECHAQLRRTQEILWERDALQTRHDALTGRVRELEQELDTLDNHQTALDWARSQAEKQHLEAARADARTALLLERALAEKYTDNPDRAVVNSKIAQGRQLLEELELSLEAPPENSSAVTVTAIGSALLLAAALLTADRGLLWPCIIMAIVMLFACISLAGRQHRRRIWYNIEQTRRQGRYTELKNFVTSWESQLRVLDELDRARENVSRTQQRLAELELAARSAPEIQPPELPDPLTLNDAGTLLARRECSEALEQCRRQLAQVREQLQDLPEKRRLQTHLAQTRFRLRELEKTEKAIGHAREAMDDAARELRSRSLPRITAAAARFLERMTGPDRSTATGGQRDLALRLAVWDTLSPDSPLILDDALIRFDQQRLEKALDLLKDLGRGRQILLLSCQDRERAYLER